MVTIFQLIAILFGLFMIFLTYTAYKKKRVDPRASLLWFLLWTGLVIGVLLFSTISNYALTYLGVLAEDLFTYVAIFVLLMVCFNLFAKYQDTRKQIKEITTELAKRDARSSSAKHK